MSVSADHAGEISRSVIRILFGWQRERARTRQLVVDRQMGAALRAPFGTGDVLPAPICQAPVIAAGDELGAVFQRHPVCRLGGRPMIKDVCDHIATIPSWTLLRPVDAIARPHFTDWFRPAVGHEDRRLTLDAV